jgi:glycerol-3-phosphate dehydrogenase
MSVKADVLIIGGGVGGTSIARELSRYEADVTLIEKGADVCGGSTKACCAIVHPGAKWTPGTLAQRLIGESNRMIDRLAKDLDVELKRPGEIILAFNQDEFEALKVIKKQGEAIKAEGLEIIGKTEIRRLEPNASPKAIAALYKPTAGVVNPWELTFAFYENAKDNGVKMLMETEVIGIVPENDQYIVETSRGDLRARYIVNAAGLFAEEVAKMVGAKTFKVFCGKGSSWILDKRLGNIVNHIVMGLGDLKIFSRIKLVTQTFHGNLMIYRTIPEPAKGKDDDGTEGRILDLTLESSKLLLPDIDFEKYIIASFAGVVAANDRGDFVVEAHEAFPTFINAALAAPGVTCAPAVGIRVVELLKKGGLVLRDKPNHNPYRKSITKLRNLSDADREACIRNDPRYGRVICRCETVSEGEIVDAVQRGATTLDGVKFRTRAGMGRCQGNHCGPKVASILATEMRKPMVFVTKKGRGSSYYCDDLRS